MKKNQFKTTLLVLLTSLMFYIWFGNIQKYNQTSSYSTVEKSNEKPSRSSSNTETIKYRKPKLNPFKRYSNSKPINKPKAQQNKRQIQQTIPKLSTQYNLKGIILEKNCSQAIITNSNGNSSIISLHEKFKDWELINIDKNQIIFKNDKLYDTLYLQTIK